MGLPTPALEPTNPQGPPHRKGPETWSGGGGGGSLNLPRPCAPAQGEGGSSQPQPQALRPTRPKGCSALPSVSGARGPTDQPLGPQQVGRAPASLQPAGPPPPTGPRRGRARGHFGLRTGASGARAEVAAEEQAAQKRWSGKGKAARAGVPRGAGGGGRWGGRKDGLRWGGPAVGEGCRGGGRGPEVGRGGAVRPARRAERVGEGMEENGGRGGTRRGPGQG